MSLSVRQLGLGVLLLVALVSVMSAQSRRAPAAPAPAAQAARVPRRAIPPPLVAPVPAATFTEFCVDCHGKNRPKGGVSIARLLDRTTPDDVAADWEHWLAMADRMEARHMPPEEADAFPNEAQRAEAVAWIRASLDAYDAQHAGEPGRVTVRRLTSAEYGYALRDLTGIDIKVGVDASSDAVGGEGFANFGDVQFVQDATVERYLEAAKQVADHAVVGAGPLEFYTDPGKTGLELSALNRIERLYATHGFRVVSGEGGRPFGFDRYAKALYISWHYKHRAALGEPTVTLRTLAAREGIPGRFAEHMWGVVQTPAPRFPSRVTIDRWKALPVPARAAKDVSAQVRAECEAITKHLVSWPSWFFARGDLAAGGQGDENPLVFDDTTLGAVPAHSYRHALNRRFGRPASRIPSPWTVHIAVDALQPDAGEPLVVWRNARVVLRTAPPPPEPNEPAAVTRRRAPGPIVATHPLRTVVDSKTAAALGFGRATEGATLGPDDFAIASATSLVVTLDAGEHVAELLVDAEIAGNPDSVVRVMMTDSPAAVARTPGQRVFLGRPESAGYRAFRDGIAEFVALLPPNSHGAANPADKDPVPAPFDNTYNSPEHDAFVTSVKYQRTDDFFTNNIVDGPLRARLEHAWADLFGSWPYHDAYLGMLLDHFAVAGTSRKIADMAPAAIAALPGAARPHVEALRRHYDATVAAMRRGEPGHVADALAFASRAWRRPLTASEQANLRAFYEASRRAGTMDHDAAVRALIARILMSPAFLYRVETSPADTETALGTWELASRLSFFLWSSIPDEELRRAARTGELRDPRHLASQVRRMTADPKARRLSTEFFGQWLGFYHFDQYRGVDTGRFPEFTDAVRTSMYDEAVSTFEYLVRQNRPVREILHADYTFLDATLATFYGIEKKAAFAEAAAAKLPADGPVQRVDGAKAFDRGGALRLGAVLTTTSAPLRTSPVKRGDWILRRILGTPTPPPPADAGTLPADDKSFEGQTLRERLGQHKTRAACASCHLRIDPLGFPLEGFDAVGRSRQTYADGKPVDVVGEFKDQTTIVGADGLLTHLRQNERAVMTTLSRKMIGYALGRNPQASDRRLIAAMIDAGGGASFADLATRIVTSRQFRFRAGRSETAAPLAPLPAHGPTSTAPTSARAGTP